MKVWRLAVFAATATLATQLGALSASAAKVTLFGRVASGDVAITGSTVKVFAAGKGSAELLASGSTNAVGNFRLQYESPGAPAVVYVVADGGSAGGAANNGAIRLASVVAGPPRFLEVNELSTVATAYAFARFLDGKKISGPAPGLPNAGAMFFNLATSEGTPAGTIAMSPNGSKTEALATFNSLADVLSACVRDAADCDALFEAATPPGGSKPTDTLGAAQAIALSPGADAAGIFALLPAKKPYRPFLTQAPVAWTIALKFTAGGFDGPGAMAFDKDANIWVTNNFMPPDTTAGKQLTVLDPVGKPMFGSPVTGGGLDGTGWGIAVAQDGKVWAGNYAGGSMSLFNRIGKPLSGKAFAGDKLDGTQGVTVDFEGNVWASSNKDDHVVRFKGGDRTKTKVVSAGGIEKPFAISVDPDGNLWIANAGKRGSVSKINPNGKALGASPIDFGKFSSPKGIAVDRGGNVWVADFLRDGVWVLDKKGDFVFDKPIRANSLDGAWGLAIDGNENVWVVSFLLKRVNLICGRNTETCPPGSKMGDIISPKGGFRSEAFQHLTGVSVDPSGNLWVANNWKTLEPIAGGDGLVALIGAAAPVKTPLLGPPQKP
jgi:DNA-binding beta-propeller fold protein YncE